MKLKSWVVKVLGTVVATYIMFVATTIESLGNKTYNTILIVYTLLAIISMILLDKYSDVLDD